MDFVDVQKIYQPNRHGDSADVGTFSIDATLTSPYLKIENTTYLNQKSRWRYLPIINGQ